jgi:predicted PurR-regulated permease PerM
MPTKEQTRARETWSSVVAEGPVGASQLATLGVLALAVAALYFGREILIPVALATLLSFALEPLATRLRRIGVPRTASVMLAVALALVVIVGVTYLVGRSVMGLIENVPVYQQNIERKIHSLQQGPPGGNVIEKASNAIEHIEAEISKPKGPPEAAPKPEAQEQPLPVRVVPAPGRLRELGGVAQPFLAPLGTAGLVVVFLIFMLLEQEEIRDRFIRLAGRGEITTTTQALGEAADRVSRYLLMQLLINASYGVPIGIGLYFIGVPNALLWGLLAIVLRFIPYVGPIIAASFPIALAVAVDPGWSMVLWTVALFIGVELVCNNVIEPWLYGHSTGLSTVAILVAAIFWTTLWGPVGLLLSTPLTVCLVVLGRHVPQLRFLDVLLGSAPALQPAERFYQRMLAGDTGEGEEMAEPYLAEGKLGDFFDEVALPALRLAEHDRRREALRDDRAEAVASNVRLVIDALPDDADDDDADAETATVEPESDHARILCVAGRTPLDAAAAAILARCLSHAGIEASVASTSLDSEAMRRLDAQGREAVVLVHLGASGVAHARQTLRRLRRVSRAERLVALLDDQLPAPVTDEQVKSLNANGVALTLGEAVQWIASRFGKRDEEAMMPAPIPECEAERLAELMRLDVLDTPREAAFDRITARLREALNMPTALVSLIDAERQFWKSASGLPEQLDRARQAPRETSICGHVVAANETLVIEDVLRDRRFAGNPFLREHNIRFYAGAPLRTEAGLAIGSLCVLDTRPRRINASERRLLSIIADQVIREMESAKRARTPRVEDAATETTQSTAGDD